MSGYWLGHKNLKESFALKMLSSPTFESLHSQTWRTVILYRSTSNHRKTNKNRLDNASNLLREKGFPNFEIIGKQAQRQR